ncbi:MAG: hypothetical protein ACYCWW_06595 [Deltaproteobacteria bacterium]
MMVALLLAGCPIPPDNFDGGTPDGGDAGSPLTDGGAVDAGSLASGNVSCLVGTSTQISQAAQWVGPDLAGTTAYADSNSGTTQVNLVGQNAGSGELTLGISGLSPGTQAGALMSAAYSSPGGGTSPDSWSCTAASNTCGATFAVQAFDGTKLTGSFQIQFEAAASTSGAQAASLSNGSFAISLPH